MAKYKPLTEFLKSRPENSVVLAFADIEEIIGDKLPPGAHRWFTAWDNRSAALQDGWLNAGWETIMVDMENETVRLKRTRSV